MNLLILEAARKTRRIGAIYGAWCEGYAAARARKPARPDRASEFMGSLGTWWLRGYRLGLKQRPQFEQLELVFGGSGQDERVTPTGGAASAVPRKAGRAVEGSPACLHSGGAT